MRTVRYAGPATPPIVIATADGGTVVTDDDGVAEVDDQLAKTLSSQDDWEAVTKQAARSAKED